jgi:predicted amidohydrolase/ribosomal protein S18 acetylase RimI-like enzyme
MHKTAKKKSAAPATKAKSGPVAPPKHRARKLIRKRAHKLVLRNLRPADYEHVQEIMDLVYPEMGGAWTREQFASQLEHFPEGQICIEDQGRVVAAALALIVQYSDWGDKHTYAAIIDNGYFKTHTPDGDTLYGADLFVHPDYRDLRLGRRLYDARKELCERLDLRAIVTGGRIPGYKKHAGAMTPRRYIELVKNRELHDPVLSFQLANEFHVRKVIAGYEPLDKETRGYATLLEWINIYYEETRAPEQFGQPKEVVRVGAVQWQMRPVSSFEDLMKHLEFFVDTVAGYKADFLLLPEFFGAALMAQSKGSAPAQAIRLLAEHGPQILDELQRLRHCAQARAIENECYVVITGSVGNLPNVENMDIQYSQAAIFTPSDFSFPHDGIAAEATPNTETVLVADLDLSLLKELHTHGSVRNLVDRRLDLYSLGLRR